ncbi:MAG TPA: hypothetical protein VI032_20835 [Burkholderiaceae bacterium]
MTKRLAVLLGVLFAVCVGVLLAMPMPSPGSFAMEVAKALLQLGVVAVASAVVSLFVFEYQRQRQNEDKQRELERKALEYREDLLKGTLTRAMAAYSQTKKVRRLLRARAVEIHSTGMLVAPDQYDACFDLLNDAQLELENLARDVRNSAPAFSSPGELEKRLWSMEKYLSRIITEYEQNRGRIPSETGRLLLQDLPELERFIESTSSKSPPASAKGPFASEVVGPYHDIQLEIRKDLLHPQLPGRV